MQGYLYSRLYTKDRLWIKLFVRLPCRSFKHMLIWLLQVASIWYDIRLLQTYRPQLMSDSHCRRSADLVHTVMVYVTTWMVFMEGYGEVGSDDNIPWLV